MMLSPIKLKPNTRELPHCDLCNKPVDSVSWERYFDGVSLNGYSIECIPNGCGHVEVECHGEIWRVKFFPWGFGTPEIRWKGGHDKG